MKEGRSQYIGIILISILVYILAARFFKGNEETSLDDVANIEVVDSLNQDNSNLYDSATNGDSVEVDAAEYAAQNEFGAFYPYLTGEAADIVLENELVKLTLSSKGAQVKQVELKDFKKFDKSQLILIDGTQEINYLLELEN